MERKGLMWLPLLIPSPLFPKSRAEKWLPVRIPALGSIEAPSYLEDEPGNICIHTFISYSKHFALAYPKPSLPGWTQVPANINMSIKVTHISEHTITKTQAEMRCPVLLGPKLKPPKEQNCSLSLLPSHA